MQNKYQLWRFITPALLSNGFSQCFIGIFLLLLIGSMIESAGMGTYRLLSLYVACVVGGYVLGASCTNKLSVGCYPGVFGLTGALLSNVIKNWIALEKLDSMRFCLILFSLMIFLLCLMVSYNDRTIDVYG